MKRYCNICGRPYEWVAGNMECPVHHGPGVSGWPTDTWFQRRLWVNRLESALESFMDTQKEKGEVK